MKHFLIAFLCVGFALSCSKDVKENSIYAVVPFPNDVECAEGTFLAKGAAVTYDSSLDKSVINILESFANQLSLVSGEEIIFTQTTDSLSGFCFSYDENIPSEAYKLEITPESVNVHASDLRGFNYAVQTIKQLLPVEIYGKEEAADANWAMPCVTVNDAPRFAYRGLHLDEARHFFGVEEVKRYLDIMEVHKLNKFHWHLTDDQGWRIEIKKYPRLTEVGALRKGTCIKKDFSSLDGVPYGEGAWYTHEQIKEVVAYAAAKGIDVIPEIDLPGHMVAALAAYPELGCTGGPYEVWTRWGISDDVLCAGNENIYPFLEDILAEVCELFPYEYVHIGGDECPKVRWEECPKCQAKIKSLGLKDKDGHKAEHFLQSHIMMCMEQFLNAKGKKVIGWDEILEGEIAPNATIMSWRGEAGGIEATRLGHDAIMTPNTYFYLDYYQSTDTDNEPFGIGGYLPVEKSYSYEPYVAGMTDEQKSHILGVQANMWTEYIAEPDHLEYMLLPRLAALSEVQWCSADRKNWERFSAAADRFCSIYDVMDYNYATHIFQVNGIISSNQDNNCVAVTLQAQGAPEIRYTLDGGVPGKCSELYTEPILINESCELKAVSMRKGMVDKVFYKKFDFHKAVGKKLTFSRDAHPRYCAGGPLALVDAIRGPKVFSSKEWLGWYGYPVDLVIEMGETQPYSSVSLGLLTDKPSYIFLPEKISVAVSEDGENYVEVAELDYGIEKEDHPDDIYQIALDFPQTYAKYLKLTITPVSSMPEWHGAPGRRAFFFIDEVTVM